MVSTQLPLDNTYERSGSRRIQQVLLLHMRWLSTQQRAWQHTNASTSFVSLTHHIVLSKSVSTGYVVKHGVHRNFTIQEKLEIYRAFIKGTKQKDLAERYSVSMRTIKRVVASYR